jgi:hypothetical protein
MPTDLQILSQVQLVETICVELVEEVINQLIVEGQSHLQLSANISKMKCKFQRGIILPRFGNM